MKRRSLPAGRAAAAAPALAAKYFMYVGSYTAGTSKGIYAWTLRQQGRKRSSRWAWWRETPQPAHVWIAPNGKTLYTVNWENDGRRQRLSHRSARPAR